MLIALWIVNGLLALVMLAAGGMKAASPKSSLAAKGLVWTEDFSAAQVKTIGVLEVLGAIGLIVPLATGILPILTPIASVCLALTMIGAVVVHVRRKESAAPAIVLTVVSAASAALGFLAL